MSRSRQIQIIDGSFGSQLNKYVQKPIDGDPLWSARHLSTNPEAVIKVHLDYIRSCDIIETNSYQASIAGFQQYLNLSADEGYQLIKKSVDLVKIAIERAKNDKDIVLEKTPLIAGSIGPYGAYLHDGSEYRGQYELVSNEELERYHKPRIAALVEGGVDLFAIETIPSRKEAEILVELIKEYPSIKAWLSFSCKDDDESTAHGDNFADAAISCLQLNRNQILAVGVNCIAPHAVEGLLKSFKKKLPPGTNEIPLVVYANSGEKYDPVKGWDCNSECLENYIPAWLDLGVDYIGGCCRVCDNYLKKIISQVHTWTEKNH